LFLKAIEGEGLDCSLLGCWQLIQIDIHLIVNYRAVPFENLGYLLPLLSGHLGYHLFDYKNFFLI